MAIEIVPSILSADFTRLGEQVREAEEAGAQRIQVDVMDGHFVPNITMGAIVVEAVRRCTTLPLEAHLMIDQRGLHCDIEVDGGIHESTVPLVVKAGANLLVAGSAIYNERESVAEAIARLRNAI